MKTRIFTAALALLMSLCASSALAATIMDMTVKEAGNDSQGRVVVTIEGKLLRMDMEPADSEEKVSMIFRGDRHELMVLNHARSEALVMDKETMERLAAQMHQAMEQMKQAMANVPEEQRAMMQQMMKGKMGGMAEPPPPTEVRKTSETGETNGYPWVRYDVFQDGDKIQEYLVTDWSNVGIDESTFDIFKELADFFQELGDSFGAGMAAQMENPLEEMNKLDGFPVVTRRFHGGAMVESTELQSVTTGDVDAGTFENPGYKVNKLDSQMR